MVKLDPYIFFHGQAREAMEFYKAVFGGELTSMTYTESKMDAPEGGDADTWLMHADLTGGMARIMASDTEKASDKAAKVSLSLSGEEGDDLEEVFEKLSDGGSVFQELKQQFWGDTFGSCTDKYGVEWMVNIAAKK